MTERDETQEAHATPAGRIRGLLGTLDRDERLELTQRIETGAEGGVDFVVMMALAALLASLGLLQGSTAVVIGAMLVAPLMGPLIGAGMALIQGNRALFVKAMQVAALGTAVGFGLSVVFGVLNPGYEPSLELEARGTPDVLDLVIALASGMVAAYAAARPNVSGTLAGVAIAAALLPPLAVVGIGITNARPLIAMNAAVLFVTNLVAIILGAALVFRVLGAHAGRAEAGWARTAIGVLLLVGVILIAPLTLQLVEKGRTGQDRPYLYPVAAAVRESVADFIDTLPGIRTVSMARISVEPKSGITVMVAATGTLPDGFRDDLVRRIREARGADVKVRVFAFKQDPEAVPEPVEGAVRELPSSPDVR